MFGRYTPDDYDKHHYLKPGLGFYGLLLVLLRPYIVWIVSVANRNDATVLLESLYPNKYNFFAGLAVGFGAVLVFAMFSLRRENAYSWLPNVWKRGRMLLWGTLSADIVLTVYLVKKTHFHFEPSMAVTLLALFFSVLFLAKSERMKDLFEDWPQESLPSDNKEQT